MYVTKRVLAAVKNQTEIVDDFMSLLEGFFMQHPECSTAPFYIVAESYGGKMAVSIAKALRIDQQQDTPRFKADFRCGVHAACISRRPDPSPC